MQTKDRMSGAYLLLQQHVSDQPTSMQLQRRKYVKRQFRETEQNIIFCELIDPTSSINKANQNCFWMTGNRTGIHGISSSDRQSCFWIKWSAISKSARLLARSAAFCKAASAMLHHYLGCRWGTRANCWIGKGVVEWFAWDCFKKSQLCEKVS